VSTAFDQRYGWGSIGGRSTGSKYAINLPRDRRYELTIGEIFCQTLLAAENKWLEKISPCIGNFHRILNWNGDILQTEIVATAFYGTRQTTTEVSTFCASSRTRYEFLQPTNNLEDAFYFLFIKDIAALEKETDVRIDHLSFSKRDSRNYIGDFFFERTNNSCRPTEYDMVDRMSIEEMLISPFPWIRMWPTINEENKILYGE